MRHLRMQESAENKILQRGIDWDEVYRRLEKAEEALEECWQPDEERQQQLLQERTFRLAKSREDALSAKVEPTFPVIEFRLAEERYAIEAGSVKEVLAPKDLTPVPCTPSFVVGIINERGQIISVIDLRKFFGLPITGLTDLNMAIIVRGQGLELGILADEIICERNLPLDAVIAYPACASVPGAEWLKKYSKGVTSDGLHMLALDNILADPRIVIREEIEADFLPGG